MQLAHPSTAGSATGDDVTLDRLRRETGDQWVVTRITGGFKAVIHEPEGVPVPGTGARLANWPSPSVWRRACCDRMGCLHRPAITAARHACLTCRPAHRPTGLRRHRDQPQSYLPLRSDPPCEQPRSLVRDQRRPR